MSVFASPPAPVVLPLLADPKEQTDDESDSPDSNALDDASQSAAKRLKTEPTAALDTSITAASPGPSSSPASTSAKKQPEPELSDAAKHVLFERRWSPEFSSDWSSSSALSLHLSWQKLIDQLQQQFGVRWTKKKLADAADHAKKVYVDRRKAARLPGHRTPQPWKWHQLMDSWLGPAMADMVTVKDEHANSAANNTSLAASSSPQSQPPPLPASAGSEPKPAARGPPPSLASGGSASTAGGVGASPAMDGALNHALYALGAGQSEAARGARTRSLGQAGQTAHYDADHRGQTASQGGVGLGGQRGLWS